MHLCVDLCVGEHQRNKSAKFLIQHSLENVTLSHLRTKEFQRLHLPCKLNTGRHLNVHWCTFRCIPGKWLHFKRASHFHQSKPSLDVDEDSLLFLWQFRSKLIVGINHCSCDDNHKVNCYQNLWRHFGILVIQQVKKCYLKVKTSFTECFANADMPTLWMTPL